VYQNGYITGVRKIEPVLKVYFFKTDGGNEPVREWLKSLPREEKKTIGEDIKTVQFGWPIGMPLVRPLGDNLYETRSNLKNKIARIFFTLEGKEMILLHGFVKKGQKIPKKELVLAKRRLSRIRGGD
jgi:phage-related protein